MVCEFVLQCGVVWCCGLCAISVFFGVIFSTQCVLLQPGVYFLNAILQFTVLQIWPLETGVPFIV